MLVSVGGKAGNWGRCLRGRQLFRFRAGGKDRAVSHVVLLKFGALVNRSQPGWRPPSSRVGNGSGEACGSLGRAPVGARSLGGDYLLRESDGPLCLSWLSRFPSSSILISRLLEGHMSTFVHKPLAGLCQFKKWGQPGREVPQKIQAAAEPCPGL